MHSFYDEEVSALRQKFGNFILINTNFNHVNAFYPGQNLFQPVKAPGEIADFGQAARGMPRAYAEGFRDHKQAVFEDFQKLIPLLEKSFPDYAIVVRPHPTENQAIYHSIAQRCQRVNVTNEGNVVPWLMAAKALIHNGCTTGVEAYVMGVPAISYRPTVNDYYDDGFYRLPNRLSHQCFSFEALQETLGKILSAELGAAEGEQRRALVDRHLAALDGPPACERIVDVIEKVAAELAGAPLPPAADRFKGWFRTTKRRIRQRYKSRRPGSLKSQAFERHRYPPIDAAQIDARLARFQRILGFEAELRVAPVFAKLFRISA
jgi:hypothetical protein